MVILTNSDQENQSLEATILPEGGMNLKSFRRDSLEIIEPSTETLYKERYAGLGALIGPHFHHRSEEELSKLVFDTTLFPHIARVKKKGVKEPFSHGIARYAPWKYQHSLNQLQAKLSGKDDWQGIKLRDLEGQDFDMQLSMILMSWGLRIRYEIESEKPSVLGFHYYYTLPDPSNDVIIAEVEPKYRYKDKWAPIPKEWLSKDQKHLCFPAGMPADFGFLPVGEEENRIILKTKSYELHVVYLSSTKEHSFQIYHPEKAGYICIEPLSATNPNQPIHNRNLLECKIEIFHY